MKQTVKAACVFLSVFVSWSGHAQLKSKGKVAFHGDHGQLVFAVQPGFHFNVQAPQTCLVDDLQSPLMPQVFSQNELRYPTENLRSAHVRTQFFVCDDALTVCEPHTYTLQLAADGVPSLAAAPKAKRVKSKASSPSAKQHGFIVDDFAQALKEAVQNKKLIFVDAGASWCPPCMRLETEVFGTVAFQAATKKYVKLKLNVDALENQEFLNRYGIASFPTMLILTATGDEILRIKDFMELKPLSQRLKQIASHPPPSRTQIMKNAEAGDRHQQNILGILEFQAGRFEDAQGWFQRSGMDSVFARKTTTELAKRAFERRERGTESAYRKSLEQAIKAFPESLASLDWREDLSHFTDEKRLLTANAELLHKFLAQPELFQQAVENEQTAASDIVAVAELAHQLALTYETLKMPDQANAAWERVLTEVEKAHPTVKQPGILVVKIQALGKLKREVEALDLLHQLQKKYPKEFTYYYREARLLKMLNRLEEAHSVSQKAYLLSTGLNRIYAGRQLVEIKKDLKRIDEAQRIMDEILDFRGAEHLRLRSYWKELLKLQDDLRQTKPA